MGLSVEQVMEQIQIFREGAVPLKLNRPCTLNDGIRKIEEYEGKALAELHDQEAQAGRMIKFVPASGGRPAACSRTGIASWRPEDSRIRIRRWIF